MGILHAPAFLSSARGVNAELRQFAMVAMRGIGVIAGETTAPLPHG